MLIDLTHPLNNSTPVFPGDAKVNLYKYKDITEDKYNGYVFETTLHIGTHIDAPMHLTEDNRFIDSFPLDCFTGKGVLIDVRREDIISMKSVYENLVFKDAIVLLYTGFDEFYYDKEKYFNAHPVISEELTNFFIQKQIKMLGMDISSPDYAPFTAHKALLSKDIFILENLTNLKKLSDIKNFEVYAFPLKITAEASQVRAMARIL